MSIPYPNPCPKPVQVGVGVGHIVGYKYPKNNRAYNDWCALAVVSKPGGGGSPVVAQPGDWIDIRFGPRVGYYKDSNETFHERTDLGSVNKVRIGNAPIEWTQTAQDAIRVRVPANWAGGHFITSQKSKGLSIGAQKAGLQFQHKVNAGSNAALVYVKPQLTLGVAPKAPGAAALGVTAQRKAAAVFQSQRKLRRSRGYAGR